MKIGKLFYDLTLQNCDVCVSSLLRFCYVSVTTQKLLKTFDFSPDEMLDVSTSNIRDGTISLSLTGLNGNTVYYYKVYILTNEGDSIYSSAWSFKTEPPPLELSLTIIDASIFAGTYQFEVLSTTTWMITSNQSWCTVQPESGYGNSEITVSVTDNTTDAQRRSAILMVTAGNLSMQVMVEQSFPTLSDIEPEMVFVQGGIFAMGCTSE
jgi:hypothetical protein